MTADCAVVSSILCVVVAAGQRAEVCIAIQYVHNWTTIAHWKDKAKKKAKSIFARYEERDGEIRIRDRPERKRKKEKQTETEKDR